VLVVSLQIAADPVAVGQPIGAIEEALAAEADLFVAANVAAGTAVAHVIQQVTADAVTVGLTIITEALAAGADHPGIAGVVASSAVLVVSLQVAADPVAVGQPIVAVFTGRAAVVTAIHRSERHERTKRDPTKNSYHRSSSRTARPRRDVTLLEASRQPHSGSYEGGCIQISP
jgi:hypothetical protein